MNRLVLPCLCVCIAVPSMASDFGTAGLIDIPTARMSAQMERSPLLRLFSHEPNPTPLPTRPRRGLREPFSYTGFNKAALYYDRNYEAKIALWEGAAVPSRGCSGHTGFSRNRCFGGLSIWLRLKRLEILMSPWAWVGAAWRVRAILKIPMTWLSDTFSVRDSDTGLGGELSTWRIL